MEVIGLATALKKKDKNVTKSDRGDEKRRNYTTQESVIRVGEISSYRSTICIYA